MGDAVSHNLKTRICFVAHFAYGALTGGSSGYIGGVERQTSLMARWFAQKGYTVSMLTWDEGQEDDIEIDGVRVFKMCRRDAGVPGLRFFWPKWTSLIAAMKRANADVYYQNNAEYVTGQIASWCRKHGRKFIYSVASDSECQAHLPRMRPFPDRHFYRYGLSVADEVIVQTRKQQGLLQSDFGRASVVIPMPCPGPSQEEYEEFVSHRKSSQRILWVGRICEVKRPDRLLDLAEACPELEFDLVGPSDGSTYSQDVCRRAEATPNIKLHGPAMRKDVPNFYRKAKLMCCTSDFEGFPNTFLEAWSYGLPIISTFDPECLISERGLGRVGHDVCELTAGIREMLNSEERWNEASQRSREHYLETHSMDKAMRRFERVFVEMACVPRHHGSKFI